MKNRPASPSLLRRDCARHDAHDIWKIESTKKKRNEHRHVSRKLFFFFYGIRKPTGTLKDQWFWDQRIISKHIVPPSNIKIYDFFVFLKNSFLSCALTFFRAYIYIISRLWRNQSASYVYHDLIRMMPQLESESLTFSFFFYDFGFECVQRVNSPERH